MDFLVAQVVAADKTAPLRAERVLLGKEITAATAATMQTAGNAAVAVAAQVLLAALAMEAFKAFPVAMVCSLQLRLHQLITRAAAEQAVKLMAVLVGLAEAEMVEMDVVMEPDLPVLQRPELQILVVVEVEVAPQELPPLVALELSLFATPTHTQTQPLQLVHQHSPMLAAIKFTNSLAQGASRSNGTLCTN